jgi:death on curing protein
VPFLFPTKQEVLAIHARLIEAFGGSHGLRDEGALESALASAEYREYYENADLVTCAATYAYHLTQAHAFVDGNKRIAAAVSEVFLKINGARMSMTDEQIVRLFLDIAASILSRDEAEQLFQQCVEFEN